jgi:DNA-binding XRE family transcriptional regulator
LEVRKRLAIQIKSRRIKAGLTQAELANRSGVPQQLISSYERERYEPQLTHALSLAHVLQFDLNELLDFA